MKFTGQVNLKARIPESIYLTLTAALETAGYDADQATLEITGPRAFVQGEPALRIVQYGGSVVEIYIQGGKDHAGIIAQLSVDEEENESGKIDGGALQKDLHPVLKSLAEAHGETPSSTLRRSDSSPSATPPRPYQPPSPPPARNDPKTQETTMKISGTGFSKDPIAVRKFLTLFREKHGEEFVDRETVLAALRDCVEGSGRGSAQIILALVKKGWLIEKDSLFRVIAEDATPTPMTPSRRDSGPEKVVLDENDPAVKRLKDMTDVLTAHVTRKAGLEAKRQRLATLKADVAALEAEILADEAGILSEEDFEILDNTLNRLLKRDATPALPAANAA